MVRSLHGGGRMSFAPGQHCCEPWCGGVSLVLGRHHCRPWHNLRARAAVRTSRQRQHRCRPQCEPRAGDSITTSLAAAVPQTLHRHRHHLEPHAHARSPTCVLRMLAACLYTRACVTTFMFAHACVRRLPLPLPPSRQSKKVDNPWSRGTPNRSGTPSKSRGLYPN